MGNQPGKKTIKRQQSTEDTVKNKDNSSESFEEGSCVDDDDTEALISKPALENDAKADSDTEMNNATDHQPDIFTSGLPGEPIHEHISLKSNNNNTDTTSNDTTSYHGDPEDSDCMINENKLKKSFSSTYSGSYFDQSKKSATFGEQLGNISNNADKDGNEKVDIVNKVIACMNADMTLYSSRTESVTDVINTARESMLSNDCTSSHNDTGDQVDMNVNECDDSFKDDEHTGRENKTEVETCPNINTTYGPICYNGKFKRRITTEEVDNRCTYLETNSCNNCDSVMPNIYSNIIFLPDKSKGASPKRFGPKRLGSKFDDIKYEESDSESEVENTVKGNNDKDDSSEEMIRQNTISDVSERADTEHNVERSKAGEAEVGDKNVNDTSRAHDDLEEDATLQFCDDHFGLYCEASGVTPAPVNPNEPVISVPSNKPNLPNSVGQGMKDEGGPSRMDDKVYPEIPSSQVQVSRINSRLEVTNNDVKNISSQDIEMKTEVHGVRKVIETTPDNEPVEACAICNKIQDECLCLFPKPVFKTFMTVSNNEHSKPVLSYFRYLKFGSKSINWQSLQSSQAKFAMGLKSSKTCLPNDNRLMFEFKLPSDKGVYDFNEDDHQPVAIDADKRLIEFLESRAVLKEGSMSDSFNSYKNIIVNDFDESSDDDEKISDNKVTLIVNGDIDRTENIHENPADKMENSAALRRAKYGTNSIKPTGFGVSGLDSVATVTDKENVETEKFKLTSGHSVDSDDHSSELSDLMVEDKVPGFFDSTESSLADSDSGTKSSAHLSLNFDNTFEDEAELTTNSKNTPEENTFSYTHRVIYFEGTPKVTKSEGTPKLINSESAPKVTNSESTPKMTKSESTPKVTNSDSASKVTNTKSIPKVTNSEGTPKVTNSESAPKVTNSESTPKMTKSESTPKVTNSDSASKVTNTKSIPKVTNSEGTPKVTNSESTPKVTNSESTPKVTNSKSTPKVTNSESTPAVTNSKSTPKVTNSESIPKVTNSESTPKVTNSESIPKVTNSESIPKVTYSESTPKVTSSESTPKVTDSESTPKVTNSTSTPKVTNSKSTPKVINSKSTPIVTNSTSTPKVTNTESTQNVTNSESTPEVTNSNNTSTCSLKRIKTKVEDDNRQYLHYYSDGDAQASTCDIKTCTNIKFIPVKSHTGVFQNGSLGKDYGKGFPVLPELPYMSLSYDYPLLDLTLPPDEFRKRLHERFDDYRRRRVHHQRRYDKPSTATSPFALSFYEWESKREDIEHLSSKNKNLDDHQTNVQTRGSGFEVPGRPSSIEPIPPWSSLYSYPSSLVSSNECSRSSSPIDGQSSSSSNIVDQAWSTTATFGSSRSSSPVVRRSRSSSPVVRRSRSSSPVVSRSRSSSPVVSHSRSSSQVVRRSSSISPEVMRSSSISPEVMRSSSISPEVMRSSSISPEVMRSMLRSAEPSLTSRSSSPTDEQRIGSPVIGLNEGSTDKLNDNDDGDADGDDDDDNDFDELLEKMIEQEGAKLKEMSLTLQKCRFTVLCVDISKSMEGTPWQHVTEFVTEFLSGLERNRHDYGVQEYVAMVTFGHDCRIACHLTQDYQQIINMLDTIHPDGCSPMLLGIMFAFNCLAIVCDLQYNQCRLHDIEVSHRVILLSDGLPTPGASSSKPEHISNAKCLKAITEINELFDGESLPGIRIDCVPCGDDANTCFLESLCQLSGGRLFERSGVTELSRSTHNHYICAQVTHQMFRMANREELDMEMFRSLVKELYPNTTQTDMSEMEKLAIDAHARLATERSGLLDEDRNIDDHFEPQQLDNLPSIGMRVTKGPDISYGDQIAADTGTVTGHSHNDKGKVFVKWDSGVLKLCCYGYNGEWEVLPNEVEEKFNIDDDIQCGDKVRRGPDWSYGNADGGSDQIGAVYRIDPVGVVWVRWPNSNHGNYRYNHDGMFDVVKSDPTDPTGEASFVDYMNQRNRDRSEQ